LSRPGRVFLDKTGTLTEGRSRLVRWEGPDEVRPLAAALEAQIDHPVARAFVEAFGDADPTVTAEITEHRTGGGLIGWAAGKELVIGSPRFVAEQIGGETGSPGALSREFARDGLTPVLLAIDGAVVAAAGLGDGLREEAETTVAALRREGWRVAILSGDDPEVVSSVGRRLGIPEQDCLGGRTPEDKLEIVESAALLGPVMMVGDGINDAAALSAASVGVAVHGGAEVAMAVADVFLTRRGLTPLLQLLDGARRTLAVIRRNMIFSLAYNVAGAILAIGGWIDPLIAAVLMPLSSLTVITHSFRARTF
jgi:Cu2+-exporting ATPase